MAIATIWLGTLGVFAGAGAVLDITTRRLPNILCGAMLLTGLVLAFVQGGWTMLGLHAAHAVIALIIGFALFMAGVFGGGDGKFYAAVAAFFPLAEVLELFVFITFVGLALVIVWFGYTRTLRSVKGAGDFGKLPYGVAIGGGGLANAAWTLL